jgi:hypothetical protein
MIDPLGRATERLLDVPAGSPLPAPDIHLPTVIAVPGKGFVLAFQTANPVTPTPAGPYVLSVTFVPRTLFPFPPPGGRRPPTLAVTRALPDIRLAVPGENLFADTEPIPLRRARGPDRDTQVGIALRGSAGGTVTVRLRSPDGTEASLTRRLP